MQPEPSPRFWFPQPPASHGQLATPDIVELFDKGRFPPKPRALVRASAFSPSGAMVVAGYDDGRIGIHPGVPGHEHPGFRTGDLTLLADLQAGAQTPNSELAVGYLMQLDGALKNMTSYLAPGKSTDAETDHIGQGMPVTRQRILAAARDTLLTCRNVLAVEHRVVLIVYVSAHGWVGPDGRPYLLPADADGKDPQTWISYEDFLQPIYTFLAEPNEDHTFAVDAERGDMRKLVLVILDTCQVAREGDQDQVRSSQDLSRRQVIVVQATSPGRYAWHWTATLHSEGNVKVIQEHRWGFPPPPKAERGPIATSLSTRMSVLPLASQTTLKALIDEKRGKTNEVDRKISVQDWLNGTKDVMPRLLKEIPDTENPALKGAGEQKMQVQIDARQYNFWLFSVKASAVPEE
jgi:hypothetical protein